MSHSAYSFKASTLAVLALTAASWAQAACYTVYDSKNQVAYRSALPPVDMSKPLHETSKFLPAGSRFVFSPDTDICVQQVNELNKDKNNTARNANTVTDQIHIGSMITAQ